MLKARCYRLAPLLFGGNHFLVIFAHICITSFFFFFFFFFLGGGGSKRKIFPALGGGPPPSQTLPRSVASLPRNSPRRSAHSHFRPPPPKKKKKNNNNLVTGLYCDALVMLPCARLNFGFNRDGIWRVESSRLLVELDRAFESKVRMRQSRVSAFCLCRVHEVSSLLTTTRETQSRTTAESCSVRRPLVIWRACFQKALNPLLLFWRKTRFFVRICTRVYGKLKIEFTMSSFCSLYSDQKCVLKEGGKLNNVVMLITKWI